MLQKTAPFHSWKAFTRALELDFGPSTYDCPRATLIKLNQSATVNEYYMQFTALANRVDGLSVEAILDCFISGLNNEISRDVKAMEPRTLTKAVALAKLFEEKHFPNTTPKITDGPRNVTQNSTIPTKPTANYTKSDQNGKPPLPPLLPTPNTKPFNTRNQHIKKFHLLKFN